jgi:cell filamentation protein
MSPDRYNTSDLIENQYEPGSRKNVLRNLLGIKRKRDIDNAESEALKQAIKWAMQNYDIDHSFTAHDIRSLHRIWLEGIYQWAGQYRQVVMSKGGFPFAFPEQIPTLMADLEKGFLKRYTPCHGDSREELATALALVHTELLLIHPFREGNGRLARLLASIMALQSGMPLLYFGSIKGRKKEEYFAAVRAGLDRNYKPMEKIFADVIASTLKRLK